MSLLINGEPVPDRVLDQELLRLSSGLEVDAPHAGNLNPEHLRSLALRSVITRTLLLQAAKTRKLSVTSSEIEAERKRRWGSVDNTFCGADVLASLEEALLLERVSADLTRHVPRPGRADAEAFYRANKSLFFQPEAVQAAHIVRNTHSLEEERAAMEVLLEAERELARGTPFARVADRYSDCKGVGGAVGWIARNSMVPEFEDVVFALAPGECSGVFRTVFGLHIALVSRHREPGLQAFDEVRQAIVHKLLEDRRRQALAQAVTRFEATSDIRFTTEDRHE